MPKRKFFREKKKVLIATLDDSEVSEDDSEEELTHMTLIASLEAYEYGSESDSYSNEILYNLTHSDVLSELKKENSTMKEKNSILEKDNSALKSKS